VACPTTLHKAQGGDDIGVLGTGGVGGAFYLGSFLLAFPPCADAFET